MAQIHTVIRSTTVYISSRTHKVGLFILYHRMYNALFRVLPKIEFVGSLINMSDVEVSELMNGWMDGWMDRWMDGWMDRWMDR